MYDNDDDDDDDDDDAISMVVTLMIRVIEGDCDTDCCKIVNYF